MEDVMKLILGYLVSAFCFGLLGHFNARDLGSALLEGLVFPRHVTDSYAIG